MKLWVDAQLSPLIADWINENFKSEVIPVRNLGLRDATDKKIFDEAKKVNAVIMTKDMDFSFLQDRYGAPPKIIWLTCGNTSNGRLKEILTANLEKAFSLLSSGENLVEIKGD